MAIGVKYDDGSGRIGTFSKGLHSPWGDVGRIGKMTRGLAGTRPIRQFGAAQKTPLQRIEEKKAEERLKFKKSDLDAEDPRHAGVSIGSACAPHPFDADESKRTADGHAPWERAYLTGLHVQYEAPNRRYVLWGYLRADKITGEGRTFETSGETRVPIFSFVAPEEPNPAPFDIVTGDEFVQTMTNCTFYYKGEQKTVSDFDLTVATGDGEHTVYLVVTDDGSAAPTFSISNTEIEDDGVTCYKLYDFKDGEVTCDYRTTFLTIGSEDEVEVDDISIESSREIPSEIEGEDPTVVEEHAIKGWHDKDNSSSKLGDLLTGSAEDTSRQVLVRNGKGGAIEYLPLGAIEEAKNGKLTFKFANGSSDKEFTANQDDGSPVEVSIPAAANNGMLTIKYGATVKGTFTANQSGPTEVVIPEPTIPQPIQPNNGMLTIKNSDGSVNATFTANQASGTDVTLPVSANNGTLTITQGGTTLGTFTANQSTPSTIAIPVPPQPVQPNDGKLKVQFGTDAATDKFSANQQGDSTLQFAKVADTGSYNDLADKPTIPTIPDIEVDTSAVTSGKAVGGLTVDAQNKHKLIATGVNIPTPPTGTVDFVGDIQYDVNTHQLQKRVDTLNLATGAVTQGQWTMITGGQAVPHSTVTD